MKSILHHAKYLGQGWSRVFMASLSFYYILILNQHFNIPLRFIPWVLIAFAGYIFWIKIKDQSLNMSEISALFYPPCIKNLLLTSGILTFCFLLSTLVKASSLAALYDLATIFIGPIVLGIIAFVALPKNTANIRYLNLACTTAILFLGFTDIFHYCRAFYRGGAFANPILHRWFSDGYLFFMPWLFLGFFSTKNYVQKLGWLLGIWMILTLLLAIGGSRGAMVVITIQILVFVFLYAKKGTLITIAISLFCLLGLGFLGARQFAAHAIEASLKKGLFVGDRINDAWIPVMDFIQQNFWLGHGFGRAAWDQAYAAFLAQHIGWPGINWGGPHNQVLDVAFIGGIFATIAYCILCFLIVKILFTLARKGSPEIAGAALAALCSFIGLYLVRGLVESIRWEPLGIILTCCLWLSYLHQSESAEK